MIKIDVRLEITTNFTKKGCIPTGQLNGKKNLTLRSNRVNSCIPTGQLKSRGAMFLKTGYQCRGLLVGRQQILRQRVAYRLACGTTTAGVYYPQFGNGNGNASQFVHAADAGRQRMVTVHRLQLTRPTKMLKLIQANLFHGPSPRKAVWDLGVRMR